MSDSRLGLNTRLGRCENFRLLQTPALVYLSKKLNHCLNQFRQIKSGFGTNLVPALNAVFMLIIIAMVINIVLHSPSVLCKPVMLQIIFWHVWSD